MSKCSKCGEKGHRSSNRNCPKYNEERARSDGDADTDDDDKVRIVDKSKLCSYFASGADFLGALGDDDCSVSLTYKKLTVTRAITKENLHIKDKGVGDGTDVFAFFNLTEEGAPLLAKLTAEVVRFSSALRAFFVKRSSFPTDRRPSSSQDDLVYIAKQKKAAAAKEAELAEMAKKRINHHYHVQMCVAIQAHLRAVLSPIGEICHDVLVQC